jgi:hypothetical protein
MGDRFSHSYAHLIGTVLTRFLFPSKIRPASDDDRQGMREPATAEMLQSVGEKSREVALVGPLVDAPVVDVVVPVFDEERSLGPNIRRIHAYLTRCFPFSWRITIVDNASTDRTGPLAEDLGRELGNVRAVQLDRKGRGFALRTAWGASDADAITEWVEQNFTAQTVGGTTIYALSATGSA